MNEIRKIEIHWTIRKMNEIRKIEIKIPDLAYIVLLTKVLEIPSLPEKKNEEISSLQDGFTYTASMHRTMWLYFANKCNLYLEHYSKYHISFLCE